MSKYTTEVRFICEDLAGLLKSVGYANVKEVLDKSWNKVFDFDFPIFDESYRSVLCIKILKHYYTREIAFETVGLWKLKLDATMNEIMPYYNKLYGSELLKFNPLYDSDYFRQHEGSDSGSGKDRGDTVQRNNGTHTGTIGDEGNIVLSETTWDVYSDTPQGALTNVDNNTYLTNARKVNHDAETDTENTRTFNEATSNTSSGVSELNREYKNTDEYIDHIYGKMPGRSYPTLIKEFRDTFLNIDMEIIDRLNDLFFKLW